MLQSAINKLIQASAGSYPFDMRSLYAIQAAFLDEVLGYANIYRIGEKEALTIHYSKLVARFSSLTGQERLMVAVRMAIAMDVLERMD